MKWLMIVSFRLLCLPSIIYPRKFLLHNFLIHLNNPRNNISFFKKEKKRKGIIANQNEYNLINICSYIFIFQ